MNRGYGVPDIALQVSADCDLPLRGNWFGKREASEDEDPSQCKWCQRAWDSVTEPRSPYALWCNCCDTAGRKVGARSVAAIWALDAEQWDAFLSESEKAHVRRAAKKAQEKERDAKGDLRRKRRKCSN